MTAGERIKNQREKLGMTQEELAFKLGYKSRSSVNKVELCRDLSLKKVKEYAKALDCTPAYLMGWEDGDSTIKTDPIDSFTDNDFELVELFHKLDSKKQAAYLEILRSISIF